MILIRNSNGGDVVYNLNQCLESLILTDQKKETQMKQRSGLDGGVFRWY